MMQLLSNVSIDDELADEHIICGFRYFCTSWSTEISLNIHVPFVLIWSIWRHWTADLQNDLLYEAIPLFSLPWTTFKKLGIFKK